MDDQRPEPCFGVLAALGPELGELAARCHSRRELAGVSLAECELESGTRLLTCVSGAGKVRAAAGAAALIAAGASRGVLVVGVAGGLRRGMATGDLVHCHRAVQADSALAEDRLFAADPELLGAWSTAVEGATGWFLTADRPVFTPWRRARLARAWQGACVADMETAAAAAVAARAGVPWAALRAVSDLAGFGAARSFRKHFPHLAGLAADTLARWVPNLPPPSTPSPP